MGEFEFRGTQAMQSMMHVLDKTGDTKIMWNPRDADEVANARDTFKRLIDRGFRAFRVGTQGEAAERIDKFDADAEKVIFIPQLAGGAH